MTVASKVKQTLSALKGSQATLRIYAAQTQDEETRSAYNEAMVVTGEVIHDVEERLKVLEFQEPQYKGN
jgi:hypothetical protein